MAVVANMMNKSSFLTTLLISLLFILAGCEKEEVDEILVYDDFTSFVGKGGKEVRFFSNYSEIPNEIFPILSFPEHCFSEDTRVTLEYRELHKTLLPDSLVTVMKDLVSEMQRSVDFYLFGASGDQIAMTHSGKPFSHSRAPTPMSGQVEL